MAASIAWRNRLKNHKIFADLAATNKSISVDSICQNLTTIKDGEIYVWNPNKVSLMTTNLKNLIRKTESDDESRPVEYQQLLCHNAPTFAVERVLVNETGRLIALVGRRGMSVLEVPQRWGRHAEFEGGKEKIICKSIPVGERLFVGSRGCLLHACWHPGSETDTHLTLLTADNTLRVYSIENPESAQYTFPLLLGDDIAASMSFQSNSLYMDLALGENAVSFDFGSPVELQQKNKCRTLSERPGVGGESSVLAWPIYVLMGNGDVLLQYMSFYGFSSPVVGPLHMYPPAEDNYGTDACSILCLHRRGPGVIVIATAEGRLYHCVLLTNAAEAERRDSGASFNQHQQHSKAALPPSIYAAPVESSLYVYESVELELSLSTFDVVTETTLTDDDFTCPIQLFRDAVSEERYHCSHAAGVHSVALPWMDTLEQFCQEQQGRAKEDRVIDDSQPSIVEHILCTKPLPSSPPSPMLGLTMTADRLLGPTLVCLTQTLQCVVLPMLQHYRSSPPLLLSDSPARNAARSPLRSLQGQSLEQQVKYTLQRKASNPLLKTGPDTTLSPQECFQLLTRATQVFREEYVQKQDLARDQIERRLCVLRQQKDQQQEELVACMAAKNVLCDAAHGLADRLEACKDRHEHMLARMEAVYRELQGRLPVSEAESNMRKELLDAKQQIETFKANIKQVRAKRAYQERQIKTHEQRVLIPSARRPGGAASLTPKQADSLHAILKQEGTEIGDLVKQVSKLKVALDA